ncbi:MAG: T9SS type A sorting domain-containing protein [Bacteroidales bacterium]|nr:T9SS type A sorting domain-containing protein [Bacteroidales bacterium]
MRRLVVIIAIVVALMPLRGMAQHANDSCYTPERLSFSNLTDDSCTVSWHERGTATAWVVEYGIAPFTPGCGQGITMRVTDTVCRIMGLSNGEMYQVYVHADCGGGDTSLNASDYLRTMCTLTQQDLPYSYDFEHEDYTGSGGLAGYNRRHPCVMLHGNAYTERVQADSRASGSYYGRMTGCIINENSRGNGMMVFPAYDGDVSTLMVSFKAKGYWNSNSCAAVANIGVLDDFNDLSTVTRLTSVNLREDDLWDTYTVSLGTYTGTGRYVFIEADSISWAFRFDDVSLDVAPPCQTLQDLEVKKVGTSSAYITWDIPQGYAALPEGYDVQYLDSAGYHTMTVPDKNVLLEGLQPGWEYTVEVTPDCVAHLGRSDSVRFKTDCLSGGRTRHAGERDSVFRLTATPVYTGFNNNFSQTILTRDRLLAMGLVPGEIYGCTYKIKEHPSSSGRNPENRIVLIYLDSTNLSSYPATSASHWCPIDSSKRYYRGLRIEGLNLDGDERYNFDRPFVWNGRSNLVISMMTNREGYYLPQYGLPGIGARYSGYAVPTDDSVTLATFNDEDAYPEDTLPTLARALYALMPNLTLYGPCDTAESCGKPVAVLDSVSTTTVRIRWTAGWNETDWRVEHCDTSGQWVVDAASVQAREYTFTNLPQRTPCIFRVTGNCDDGRDHSDTVMATTGCGPAALPLREDFDTWATGASTGTIAPCWYRRSSNDGSTAHYPYATDSRGYSGDRSLYVGSERLQNAWLAMPAVEAAVDSLQLSLSLLATDSLYGREIVVGVMNDPLDLRTFTAVRIVRCGKVNEWDDLDVPLDGYNGNGRHVALMSPSSITSRLFVDNLLLDYINPCPRLKGLKAIAETSSSVTLQWDADSLGGTAVVEYGRTGFEPGRGTRAACNADTITIAGLDTDSCYDFYIRRVCGAGDTSRYTGPLTITIGTWNTRLMLHDTMRLCAVKLCDDGGPGGNYTVYQESAVTLLPPDTASVVMLRGRYSGNAGDLLAVYDGTDATAPLLYAVGNEASNVAVGPLAASNPSGALTVCFSGRSGRTHSGYNLDVSCLSPRPDVCDAPTDLACTSLAPYSATVTWADTGTFELMYLSASDIIMPGYTRVTRPTYTFDLLLSNTTYEWYVRRVCSDNVSPWSHSTFTTPQAPCSKPSRLATSHVSARGVTLDWYASSTHGSWAVHIEGDTVVDTVVYAHPVRLEQLSPSTYYTAKVRALCNDGGESEWSNALSFTTLDPEGIAAPSGNADGMEVTLYPNPASRHSAATLHIANADGDVLVSLLDMTGRELQRHRLTCAAGCSHRLDIQAVPQGYYFVKVQSPTSIAIRKLVVK